MLTQYVEVGNNNWGIIFCYDFDCYDAEEMRAYMLSFGMNENKADEALDILFGINSGMAISNESLRMSLVFVGNASDESEWWNSVAHEIYHVVAAIIDYYGEDYEGEPAAYLQGHIFQQFLDGTELPCD